MNLDFLLPHTAHFNNSIVLLLKGYKTLGVFLYTLNNTAPLFYT